MSRMSIDTHGIEFDEVDVRAALDQAGATADEALDDLPAAVCL